VTLKVEGRDPDMFEPNRLSGSRGCIGQTPYSYEHYLVLIHVERSV